MICIVVLLFQCSILYSLMSLNGTIFEQYTYTQFHIFRRMFPFLKKGLKKEKAGLNKKYMAKGNTNLFPKYY